MISSNRGFVNNAACTAICVAMWVVSFVRFIAAQSGWQAKWEKTLRAAEAEGQFALYGCCYDYDRVLEVFRKRYPKIKPNIVVAVAGNSQASRILAERRAEKYLVDVVSSGANMLHDALYEEYPWSKTAFRMNRSRASTTFASRPFAKQYVGGKSRIGRNALE